MLLLSKPHILLPASMILVAAVLGTYLSRKSIGLTMNKSLFRRQSSLRANLPGNEWNSIETEYLLRFNNLAPLYKEGCIHRLYNSNVAIIGLGGVGSWCAEALARSGVGRFTLCDMDDICTSNVNRQVHAATSSIGMFKADALRNRILDINPFAAVDVIHSFIRYENVDSLINETSSFSVVIDAADSVTDKAAIINACVKYNMTVITCGGAGGIIDPTLLRVSDLARTEGDNLIMWVKKKLRQCYGFPTGIIPKGKNAPKVWNILAVHTLPTGLSRGAFDTSKKSCKTDSSSSAISSSINEGTAQNCASFRKCDTGIGNACFSTGAVGFIMASAAVKMIANGELLPPKVKVNITKAVEYQDKKLRGQSPQSTIVSVFEDL